MVFVEEKGEGVEGRGWCWLIFIEWLDKEAELVTTIEKDTRYQHNAAKDRSIKLEEELGDLLENYIIITNQLLADKKVQQDIICFFQ
jgi:NTP pyrophosphatase (non-canonical NTP hydrolase)